MRRPPPLPLVILAISLAPLIMPQIPLFWSTLAAMAGIGAIVALGLVLLTGYAGITSFGQASFVGFGAYSTALLTTQAGLSPWLTLPASIAVAALAAAMVGAITLRLSGHYLALASIAWAVSLYFIAANLDLLNRNDGLRGIPPLVIAGHRLTEGRDFLPVVGIALAVSVLLIRNLLDSRSGRAIRALRGGAAAAASCGVSIVGARLLAFIVAGALAGLAGWLFAHMQRSVNPTPFGLTAGIEYLLMAVVGGAASPAGAILGAVLVTLANDLLQDWLPILVGSLTSGGTGSYEPIAFGALMVLILQLAPDGIWPLLAARRGPASPAPAPASSRPAPSRPAPSASAGALSTRPRPAAGTVVLRADHLTQRFGGLVAVNDVSLTVHHGEIVGLIGPNGAGKSTSFNMLGGAARPSSGSVEIAGTPFTGGARRAARLGLARSFQHVRLLPEMSVLDNAALGAHLRGRAGALACLLRLDRADEARLRAEAMAQLTRLGLADDAHRPAGTLPLGRQRLVEIARALCADPLVLLLDEPAAGLRLQEKIALAELLRALRAEGLGILLVEHDMGFVMRLADRLLVLNFGTQLATGTPAQIRADPAVIDAYLGAA